MRFLVLFLFSCYFVKGSAQDLEFTWLRPFPGGNYSEVNEFMDIAVEPSGNILLTGSVETCYGPIVARMDANGQLMQSTVLPIPMLGYGRGVRIYPLDGGKSVIAAWGGIADDYGGWNGHVIFLDSLFNVISRDTFETYTNFIDLQAYYQNMDVWRSGDSLMVAGMKEGSQGSDYIKILTFDVNTLMRIATDSFEFNGSHIWDDGTLPVVVFSDSIMLGYNHKLIIYKKGVVQAVYSDSLVDRIWDVVQHGTHYWLMTDNALIEMDRSLNVISHYPFGNGIDQGFFIDTQDTLYAVVEMEEEKIVYSIPFGGTVSDSFSIALPKIRLHAGSYHNQKGLIVAGENVVKGTVMGLRKNKPNEDDIDIIGLDYSDEKYTVKPGIVDEFGATVTLTIENASSFQIDSFVVSAPTGYGENCFTGYQIKSFHIPIAPGGTVGVGFSASFDVMPGKPSSRSFCFTVYGPNARIDDPKVNNTLCKSLMYTGIDKSEVSKQNKVWPDLENGRILIETAEPKIQIFSLFNLAGQVVMQKELTGKFNQITYDLPAGIYAWQIRNSKGELIGSDKLLLY